ncbi:MAG: PAS domain S-box protein [Anaerolineae bacterium]
MTEEKDRHSWRGETRRRTRRAFRRAFFEWAPIGFYRTTKDGRILSANPALASLLGYDNVDELLRVSAHSLYADPRQRTEQILAVEQTRKPQTSEICLRRKDGTLIWVRDTFHAVYDATGRFLYFEGSLEDVTQWRNALAALRQSQQRLALALQSADLGMYDWNLRTGEVTINDRYASMLGYAVAELAISQEVWQTLVHPDDLPDALAAVERCVRDAPASVTVEYRMRTRSGEWRWIQDRLGVVERDDDDQVTRVVGFHLDVTERRRMEEALRRLNRNLRAMMQCNEAVVRARDETQLLNQICEILVEVAGYRQVWVGRAEEDGPKTVRPIAMCGTAAEYLAGISVTWGDDPHGAGPVGTAIRTRQPCIVRDVAADPRFAPWRERAEAFGFRSVVALPLLVRNRAVGALAIYADHEDAFDDEELHLLEALAQNVSFGVASLRSDVERDELLETLFISERRLREMLESVQLVVVGLDCEGQITFCNEYLAKVVGLHRTEVIGSNWFERFVPADQRRQAQEQFGRLLDVSSIAAHFESDLLTAQGERRTISWNFTTTRDINASVIGVTGIGEDITDRLRIAAARDDLLTQVIAAHDRLQALSRRLVRVQEEERRSLARELHDEIGQSLTGLKMMVDMSLKAPDSAEANLRRAQGLLNDLIGRVRSLSLDLRPAMLDDLGLLPALLWLIDRFMLQTGLQVSFHHSGLEGRRLAPEIETAAYRIIQEALTNVARHADADHAFVKAVAEGGFLHIEVHDHGRGFDPAVALAAGYTAGLSGLRERADLLGGRLIIDSAPGQGTCIMADLPMGEEGLAR